MANVRDIGTDPDAGPFFVIITQAAAWPEPCCDACGEWRGLRSLVGPFDTWEGAQHYRDHRVPDTARAMAEIVKVQAPA